MSNAETPQKRSERILGDKDPVLALLVEISGSLKELNSTLKDHTTRLARLEDQRSTSEANLKDENVEPTSKTETNISDLHNSDNDSISSRYADIEPKGYTEPRDIKAKHPSDEGGETSMRGVEKIEVKPGEMPPLELFDHSRKKMFLLGFKKEFTSWLKEKNLQFAYDGRQGIPFDILTLAHSLNLEEAQKKVDEMETFYRDLKNNGGLFLIRESNDKKQNRIWDGSRFAIFNDYQFDQYQTLEDYPFDDQYRTLEFIDINKFSQPPTSYYKKEGPSAISDFYSDWTVKAPFRRLCVYGGIFNWPSLPTGIGDIPTSLSGLETDQFAHMLPRHIRLEQFAKRYEIEISPRFPWVPKCVIPRTLFHVNFQFVWYGLFNSPECEPKRNFGSLYRDPDERKLQQQSFLVAASWNRSSDLDADSEHWTILLMIPASFYDASKPYSYLANKRGAGTTDLALYFRRLGSAMSYLTDVLFELIIRLLSDWTGISDYIETFIASEFTFLNEEQHDSLLFDDDTFSRSRQYSWVITSTGEFIPIIDNTLKHYSEVRNWVIESRFQNEAESDGPAEKWYQAKAQEYGDRLYAILQRFNSQKARAEALRDGLFNASAVVESRLSTRLAQNVKLLTYVSIFYLPIAFCAALWAIPNITDASTRTPFVIAAVMIGFVTYIVAFNLNTLAAFGWATYDRLRKKCIQKMTDDSKDDTWRTRGRLFKRFEPDRGSDKPSEWYILLYCLRHPFALLERLETPATTSTENLEKDAKLPQAQNWKRWFQLPREIPRRQEWKGKGREGIVPDENGNESV